MNSNRRAAIYTRISNDKEGAGLGVARQAEDCRRLASDLGWEVVATYEDNDISAYQRKKARKGYSAMLKALESGEIDAVLAWHTDRLHRRTAELESFIQIIEATGAAVRTVRGGELDLATPDGRMVAKFHGAIAQREVEHGRDRVARAKAQSAAAGKYRGGPRPFGYEADGVTIKPDEAAGVAAAARQLIAGQSLRSIAKELTSQGLKTTRAQLPIDEINLRSILLRPRNAGFMEHRGEIIGTAAWEPLLAEETWRAVVSILKHPARITTTGSAPKWLGSNLYICGVCGGRTRASMGSERRRVYRCNSGNHVNRNQWEVDAYVIAAIAEILRESGALSGLNADKSVDLSALRGEADALRSRKDQLAIDYADGLLDGQQLRTATQALESKLEEVERRLAEAGSAVGMADLLAAADPGQMFQDASLARKRAIINAIATVTILPSKRGRPSGWAPGQSYFDVSSIKIEPIREI